MIELSMNNLGKYYGVDRLFHNISFELKTGERVGLIGRNGCGKTTIMKILMGEEEYQEGEISFRKDCKLGYLDQIPFYSNETTALDVIRTGAEAVNKIRQQMKELEARMGNLEGEELEKAINLYDRLQQQYELGGGYELEVKLNKITEGLKISEDFKQMLFQNMSGGERTRIILARLLLEEPDILLLDEPTNHLDLASILWLEEFLRNYKGSAIIISHDRYFLDQVVNAVVELDTDQADRYPGNYSYYVVEKERRFLIDLKNYQNQQKKIEKMEEQIERYRIWGAMRDSEVMYKRAKELEKRLEKVEVLKHPVLQKRKIRLNQNTTDRSGKIVVEVSGLVKNYEKKELLSNINLQVFYQDSVCMIGANGCGKTTLLKMILGEVAPDEGTVKIGSQVSIGYLPQHVEFPDEEQTILEYFARLHNLSSGEARSQLAKVLFFNDTVNKKIKYLSGGERSRLRLCSLSLTGVNFLVLDEPTNHLDIDSREVLEETLQNFEGTLLFVSHDRYFIDKLADKIIEIDQKTSKVYPGDYSYYQEEQIKLADIKIRKEATSEKNSDKSRKKADVVDKTTEATGKGGKNSYKLQRLEQYIEDMEENLNNLEERIHRNVSNSDVLNQLFEEKDKVSKELEMTYSEWYNLSQALK
jgi:ATPase components of ABC transporters with duplicated ATPase domains